MGLLKAGAGALGGVLADQWRDYFYCDALDAGVFGCKGQKRTSRRSSNTKADENIISNGSILAVNEGQCMLIVEQGKIVEVCAEAGEFLYDSGTEPSVFYGGLGKGLLNSFCNPGKTLWLRRRHCHGSAGLLLQHQGRLWATNMAPPTPFLPCGGPEHRPGRGHRHPLQRRVLLPDCRDPLLFTKTSAATWPTCTGAVRSTACCGRSSLTALQPAFAAISEQGVRYSALPDMPGRLPAFESGFVSKMEKPPGLTVSSFGINSTSASPEDEAMIKSCNAPPSCRTPPWPLPPGWPRARP